MIACSDLSTYPAVHAYFYMLAAHAVCDYPLQGDFLARGKNPFNPIPGVPWYQCMTAHCLIHAGAVLLITHRLDFAAAEFVAHFVIDYYKCKGSVSYNEDQFLHCMAKLCWYLGIS